MKSTKGLTKILNNPFCILGLPCNAEKIDIVRAQEKLNKLSKIGAEKSYKTSFSSDLLPEINRNTGIIQATVINIDSPCNKLFWFVEPAYIQQFNSRQIKSEFYSESNYKNIKYDCFLANYLCLIYEDNEFNQIGNWKKLLSYIEFLLDSDLYVKKSVLASRFKPDYNQWDSVSSALSEDLLTPVKELADGLAPERIVALYDILSYYNCEEIKKLKNNILDQLIVEIEKECYFADEFTESIEEHKSLTSAQLMEVIKISERLKDIGNSVITPISNKVNTAYIDSIKDIFYTKLMNLSNFLFAGRYFIQAYYCAVKADVFTPEYKESETDDIIVLLKKLKDSA